MLTWSLTVSLSLLFLSGWGGGGGGPAEGSDLRQTARLKVCCELPLPQNGHVANPTIGKRTTLMNFTGVVVFSIFIVCFKIFQASSIDIFSYSAILKLIFRSRHKYWVQSILPILNHINKYFIRHIFHC